MLYRVRRETDEDGDVIYALIFPKREEPAGDIYREEDGLWRGSANVANESGEEFDLAVVGRSLRATARALYLVIRAVVRN
jgi:hypothetical protein